jgi:hypothetical protein
MKTWKSLSRQAKLIASAGIGFIFLCSLCAVAGIFISGSQSKRTSQEDLVQTVIVETILHIQKTEDARTSTLNSLPTVAETSTETNSILLGSVNECVSSNSYEKGTVVEVVDGDTIRVQILGEVFPVRYIGIDTPDNQGSDTFTSVNSSLVLGKRYFSSTISLMWISSDACSAIFT